MLQTNLIILIKLEGTVSGVSEGFVSWSLPAGQNKVRAGGGLRKNQKSKQKLTWVFKLEKSLMLNNKLLVLDNEALEDLKIFVDLKKSGKDCTWRSFSRKKIVRLNVVNLVWRQSQRWLTYCTWDSFQVAQLIVKIQVLFEDD